MINSKCPYCIQCDAPVDNIDYGAKLETFEVRGGTVITYVEVSAFCHYCGNELYVVEVNNMNKLSRDNAYAAAMKRDRAKGEWIEAQEYLFDNVYTCSACGSEFVLEAGTPKDNEYNYCPNCGADMREEEKDER